MKKIQLAVIFDQQLHAGGGYQQAINAALVARALTDDLIDVVFFSLRKDNLSILKTHGIKAKHINISKLDKLLLFLRRMIKNRLIYVGLKKFFKYNNFEKRLINDKIDLVYFLSPTSLAQDLEYLNYITTVWDLCHRDYPEFPEVRWNREFEQREKNYKYILPRAIGVIVDSSLGKENLSKRYCIDSGRIHVIEFESAKTISANNYQSDFGIKIAEKYSLDCPYIYYPAQFWPHKNHVYILEALKLLETDHNLKIGAIFSGGDTGNISYIKKYVKKLDLCRRVCFTGFVSNEEVPELYRQSLALVMPTYFGPTNIPPLEAFALGVPVFYSNLPGLKDQTASAALLLDLKKPSSLADQLAHLVSSKELREALIARGYERLKQINDADRSAIIRDIVNDFRWKRICWE
jgi:glycosyltransferase involved in cell wall biosynthesis